MSFRAARCSQVSSGGARTRSALCAMIQWPPPLFQRTKRRASKLASARGSSWDPRQAHGGARRPAGAASSTRAHCDFGRASWNRRALTTDCSSPSRPLSRLYKQVVQLTPSEAFEGARCWAPTSIQSISISQTSFALEHATPSVSGSAGARSRSLVSADAEELLASVLGQNARAQP